MAGWLHGDGEMAGRIGALDWAATPAGPIEAWPERLLAVVDLMLATPLVSTLAVGPGRVLLYNDAAARLYGARHPGVLGRPLAEAFPDSYPEVAPLYDRAFAGEPVEVPARPVAVTPGGGEAFEATLTPVRGEGGGVAAVHMTGVEVGARLRAEAALRAGEARQAFLLDLSDRLRLAAGPQAVMATAAGIFARRLGLSLAHYLLIGPDEDAYDVAAGYDDGRLSPDLQRPARISDHGPGWGPQFRRGEAVFSDDHGTRPEADARAARAEGVRSGSAVPLIRDGRLVAIFSTASPEPRRWTDEERALQHEVAERTWAAVERARAEARLRESEARRAFLLALSDALRALDDPADVQRAAMEALGRRMGVSRAMYFDVAADGESVTLGPAHLDGVGPLPPALRMADFGAFVAGLYRSGQTIRIADVEADERFGAAERAVFAAYRIRAAVGVPLRRGGATVAIVAVNQAAPRAWTDADARLIEEAAERTWAASERAAAARALRASEERQAFLLRLSDALRPLADSGAIQATASRLLAEHLGVHRAFYADVEGEEGAERATISGQYVGSGAAPWPPTFAYADFGPAIIAELRTGAPIVTPDVGTEPRMAEAVRQAYRAFGVEALIGVALVKEGRWVAAFGVQHRVPHDWTPSEVSLVQEVAERTWAALERARAEAALAESEERYRGVFETMTEGFGIGELIRDPAGRAVDYRWIELNPALERQAGLSREWLLGRPFGEAFPDADIRFWVDVFGRAVESRAVQDYEHYFPPLDRWWAGTVTPAGGERFFVVYQDVSARKRTEAALRASEERFATFAASSSDALWVRRVGTWAFEYVSPAVQAIYGVSPEAVLADPELINSLLLPEDRDRASRNVERVGGGEAVVHEYRIRRATDGASRWVRSTGFPLRDGDGQVRRIGAIAQDVTERREAEEALRESEERQAFLLRLSDALSRLTTPDEIVEAVGARIGAHLSLSTCVFADVDEARQEVVVHQGWNAEDVPSLKQTFRMADYLTGEFQRAGRAGEAMVVRDTATDPRVDSEAYARLRVGSFVMVPFHRGGRWTHFFAASATRPRDWTADDLDLFQDISDRVFPRVERARAEAALRESEERLAAAFESVPVGVAVIDMDGVAVTSNPEYRRFLPTGIIPSRDPARGARWRGWDAEGRPLEPRDFPDARALRGERVVPGQEMIYTDDDGREVWTSVSTVPIRDEGGQVTGVAAVISDIDAAKRSGDALRESEERLRAFGEASSDVLWTRDAATLEWTYLTPAFEAIYGLGREEALSGDSFRNWLDLILPEDRDHAAREIGRVVEGERVTFEYRIRRPSDGEVRWLRNTDFPIRGPNGRIERIGGVGHDITALKRAEEAIARSEAALRLVATRLTTLVEGVPQLVWRAVDHGLWTWASPQWTAFTGQAEGDSHGWGWLDALHPADREAAREAWERSRATGEFEVEYRLRDAATGGYRWFQTRATPVRDEAGGLVEWLGTTTDVQDLREMQERLKVLVAELQHRTRNLMGVVLGVMRRTRRGSADIDRFAADFQSRIEALARVQGLLSRLDEGDRIAFDELVRAELGAMGALDRDGWGAQVVLDGPRRVRLRSSTVQTLALALHELATNAAKYGALSQRGGRLVVRWRRARVAGGEGLRVEWTESGVLMPAPGAPAGEGFGSGGYGRELIERALPYQLGAETSFELGPDGVRCTIALPLSSTAGLPDG